MREIRLTLAKWRNYPSLGRRGKEDGERETKLGSKGGKVGSIHGAVSGPSSVLHSVPT